MSTNPFQSPSATDSGPRKRSFEGAFYAATVFLFVGGGVLAVVASVTVPFIPIGFGVLTFLPAALISTAAGGLAAWRTWSRIDKAQEAQLELLRKREELIDSYDQLINDGQFESD